LAESFDADSEDLCPTERRHKMREGWRRGIAAVLIAVMTVWTFLVEQTGSAHRRTYRTLAVLAIVALTVLLLAAMAYAGHMRHPHH